MKVDDLVTVDNIIQFPVIDAFVYNMLRFDNFEKRLRKEGRDEEANLVVLTAGLYEDGRINVKWKTNGEPIFVALEF